MAPARPIGGGHLCSSRLQAAKVVARLSSPRVVATPREIHLYARHGGRSSRWKNHQPSEGARRRGTATGPRHSTPVHKEPMDTRRPQPDNRTGRLATRHSMVGLGVNPPRRESGGDPGVPTPSLPGASGTAMGDHRRIDRREAAPEDRETSGAVAEWIPPGVNRRNPIDLRSGRWLTLQWGELNGGFRAPSGWGHRPRRRRRIPIPRPWRP